MTVIYAKAFSFRELRPRAPTKGYAPMGSALTPPLTFTSPNRLVWSEGWRPPGAQSAFIK